MNKLFLGLNKTIVPQRGLFICDDVPDVPRARIFDPTKKHSFNPIGKITVRQARDFATAVYGDKDLMTYRDGKRALTRMLFAGPRLDKLPQIDHKGYQDAQDTMDDVLLSPVLRNVFCRPNNFSFNPNSIILARINRAELGEDDALLLVLFLLGHFKGHITVIDGGAYLRDIHRSLIRENRLTIGLNYLDELSRKAPELRQDVLLIKEKELSGVLYDDAVELAKLSGLRPDFLRDDNAYNRFIDEAMA